MKYILLLNTLISLSYAGEEFCYKDDIDCKPKETIVLYDVNPPEGFNLRRDVALRMISLVRRNRPSLKLALPPFSNLYHWRTPEPPLPWSYFFDFDSINDYAPVIELVDLIPPNDPLEIDNVYRLYHFEDPFEDGSFHEKWEIRPAERCSEKINFWGYNIVPKRITCVSFQGSVSKLKELIDTSPSDKYVMFTNAEVALHDEYGTAEYWRARESFKFNKKLTSFADDFIRNKLKCDRVMCDYYLSVHWRRGDFARGRKKQVPSVEGAARQIIELADRKTITVVFVATDANDVEYNYLEKLLLDGKLNVLRYEKDETTVAELKEGGVAVVDQIICSRSAFFVGTHESTFTYRIQEEREIMGFDSDTTFNRLCPDEGECERPSRWRIVH